MGVGVRKRPKSVTYYLNGPSSYQNNSESEQKYVSTIVFSWRSKTDTLRRHARSTNWSRCGENDRRFVRQKNSSKTGKFKLQKIRGRMGRNCGIQVRAILFDKICVDKKPHLCLYSKLRSLKYPIEINKNVMLFFSPTILELCFQIDFLLQEGDIHRHYCWSIKHFFNGPKLQPQYANYSNRLKQPQWSFLFLQCLI